MNKDNPDVTRHREIDTPNIDIEYMDGKENIILGNEEIVVNPSNPKSRLVNIENFPIPENVIGKGENIREVPKGMEN